jgi:hypothetical protein
MPCRRLSRCLVACSRVRYLALAVCASALMAWSSLLVAEWVRVSRRYQEMAAYCSKSEATYRSYEQRVLTELHDFESGLPPRHEMGLLEGAPMGSERAFAEECAALSRGVAEHWGRLKGVYVRASWFPWVDVPDSLRHPSWEEDMRPYSCGPW